MKRKSAPSLERVAADQLAHRAVGAPRVVGAVGRVDRAHHPGVVGAVVVGDADLRELPQLHLVEVGLREAQRRRVEIDRLRGVVGEVGHPVAQRDHGVAARQPGVVERQDVDAALEQVVAGVGEAVLAAQAGLPVVGARLVRLVVEVEAGQRHRVAEAVIDLARVHHRAIFDLGDAVAVRAAVADLRVDRRQVGHERARHRVDPAGRDDVARERLAAVAVGVAGERVVDHLELAVRREGLREVAGLLTVGRQPQVAVAGGVGAVALGRRPEERPVADDRTADAAAAQVEIGIGERRRAGEVVLGHPPLRTVLVEAAAVPLVGARLGGGVERAAAGASRLRVVGVDLHGHVLQRFDGRIGRGAVQHVGDRHAVDQVVVAAAGAAAQRQQRGVGLVLLAVELRIARGDHGGHGDGEEERRSAAARQRRQLLGVDHRAGRRRRGVDERRRAGDGDRLLELAHFEGDVEGEELLRRDPDAWFS